MGHIVMSNTEQIPTGYHLATEQERKCLPPGSRYINCLGELTASLDVGGEGSQVLTYICPDAPSVIAFAKNLAETWGDAPGTVVPAPPSKESLQREYDEFVKGLGPFPKYPANPPPLDPKRAAGALKPQLQLLPPVFNEAVAAALSHGADKYGPWNWRENKVEMMTYLGAMKRHIDALLDGEDLAPDSGVHHLGHIAASCAIVLDAGKHGTLVDNRPPQKP